MNRQVSVLVPVLNEQPSLRSLAAQLLEMLQKEGQGGEIVFIDDGSVDGTWEEILELSSLHPEIRGVRLQRNFGKAAALQAGVNASQFPYIATIDGDLQDDPAEIPAMLEMLDGPVDLVSGWKRERQDPWDRRAASWLFNRLVSSMTGVRLHDHNCGLKVARREVYDSLSLSGGLHRFIPVLAASNGFRVAERPVAHRPRQFGRSRYGAGRIPRGLRDLMTVCFLTVHRERIQFLLGLTGTCTLLTGLAGLAWMAVYWVLRMTGSVEGPPVHERPLVWYSLGAALGGLQILIMCFLAELILHRTHSLSEGYLVAAETPGLRSQSPSQAETGRKKSG